MAQSRKILINTILLTASSLVMRAIGMYFQVYLTNKIGASGVGLFQLIMSVYMLFTTFAVSGIRFATIRLISEEIGIFPNGKVSGVVRRCLVYAVIFGAAASAALLISAKTIGLLWIKDVRSILSLKVLSVSLPFLSMSAVLSGYFTAVCRVMKSAVSQLFEQLTRITVVIIVYSMYGTDDIQKACAVIMAGGALGDFVSFMIQYVLYIFDRKRYSAPRSVNTITKRMVSIAMPLALSAYARTALSTLQQLLVPAGFKKYGSSSEKALADYGIVHGMVLPIIMFPSALFYALADVIVPELTEAQMQNSRERINHLINKTIRLCVLIAIGLAAVLFVFSNEIGMLFYGIEDVGKYVKILSFLMPIMYLDSITDGMLRGLGQHMYTMWVNISDSVISVIMVYFLLPKWAVDGYIFMICFTEVFNFGLSIYKLSKFAKMKIYWFVILKSLFSAASSAVISAAILKLCGVSSSSGVLALTIHIATTLSLYVLLLRVFNCIDTSDLKMFRIFLRKREF